MRVRKVGEDTNLRWSYLRLKVGVHANLMRGRKVGEDTDLVRGKKVGEDTNLGQDACKESW
jgi:hypothetical protein